jgi:quinol monooxygenase YgiN
MLGVVATLKVKSGMETETPGTYVFMERYVDQAAVDAHRATDHFKTLGRKMGEYMDGRPEVLRLREVE